MHYQTQGIILHQFMHADNKMIVKIYTELYGMNAYLCFRSSKSKKNNHLFLPMSLVDMVAERKNKGNFDYVKEIKTVSNIYLWRYDIAKSSICIFLNEVLYKLFSEAGEDKVLFSFLFSSLHQFFTQNFISDFHLRFLTALTRELGSSPENNYTDGMIFSIEKSHFIHDSSAKKEEQALGFYFHRLLEQNLFPTNQEDVIPYNYRNFLLDMILHYYTLHITDLSQIKSHKILKIVLHS
jgi:DNA repair protein RecO (recombination protein O)